MDVDPPSSQSEPAPAELRPRRRLYSAPRRFDLATVFVVTTAYALLLGGMSALDAHPAFSAIVAGYVTLVGIGQALLFGGKRPRLASMVMGVGINMLGMLVSVGFFSISRLAVSQIAFFAAIQLVVALVQGTLLGYFAGVLVGGVFLVADVLRRRF